MLHHYLDLVTTALNAGLDSVRCHLEDITRADFDGFIIPFVQKLMELAQQSKKVVKILSLIHICIPPLRKRVRHQEYQRGQQEQDRHQDAFLARCV